MTTSSAASSDSETSHMTLSDSSMIDFVRHLNNQGQDRNTVGELPYDAEEVSFHLVLQSAGPELAEVLVLPSQVASYSAETRPKSAQLSSLKRLSSMGQNLTAKALSLRMGANNLKPLEGLEEKDSSVGLKRSSFLKKSSLRKKHEDKLEAKEAPPLSPFQDEVVPTVSELPRKGKKKKKKGKSKSPKQKSTEARTSTEKARSPAKREEASPIGLAAFDLPATPMSAEEIKAASLAAAVAKDLPESNASMAGHKASPVRPAKPSPLPKLEISTVAQDLKRRISRLIKDKTTTKKVTKKTDGAVSQSRPEVPPRDAAPEEPRAFRRPETKAKPVTAVEPDDLQHSPFGAKKSTQKPGETTVKHTPRDRQALLQDKEKGSESSWLHKLASNIFPLLAKLPGSFRSQLPPIQRLTTIFTGSESKESTVVDGDVFSPREPELGWLAHPQSTEAGTLYPTKTLDAKLRSTLKSKNEPTPENKTYTQWRHKFRVGLRSGRRMLASKLKGPEHKAESPRGPGPSKKVSVRSKRILEPSRKVVSIRE